jgi:glyoxylase-like metal-dependent hydrolase (beta-lactamase superfamily II)
MHEVAEGVYRLGAKRHNFYLVTEGGRATVVDAGGSAELRRLQRGLGSLGLALEAVEAILVTHAHTDHIGFAAEASERGVPVKVHDDEADFVRDRSKGSQVGIRDLPLWNPRAWVFLLEMVRAGAHKAYPVPSVETVADGERLDLPGRPRVLATPGHTAGHAAYVMGERGVLFSGDALVTTGILSRAAGPQLLAPVFHHDPEAALRSLNRFADLGTTLLLLPGHGEPWHGPIADAVHLASR